MKTVVITGVSRGMGKAYAEKFLHEGWHVIGTSTSGTTPMQNQNLETYRLNLTNSTSRQEFTDQFEEGQKKIDILINNAGVNLSSIGEFKQKKLSIDILRKTLEVNVIGLIDITENLLSSIHDGGQIINISSSISSLTEFTQVWVPSYAISKVAVNMYTRTLAKRLEGRHIIVSSFDPGWVKTDMGGSQAPKLPEQAAEELYALAISKVESGYFWSQGKKRAW